MIFWFQYLVADELSNVNFLLIQLYSMSSKYFKGISLTLLILFAYQNFLLSNVNFLFFAQSLLQQMLYLTPLIGNQILIYKGVFDFYIFFLSLFLYERFFQIDQRSRQQLASQNLVELSIKYEQFKILIQNTIKNTHLYNKQQIFIDITPYILMIKQNKSIWLEKSVDRIHEKYMAQKSKLLLKQQEEQMKKYIKQAKIRKKMKKPIDALKDIEYEHYDQKRKELQEKKYNLLNSFNLKQKEIEVLLTQNRQQRESRQKQQKSNNYFEVLRNRIKNYP